MTAFADPVPPFAERPYAKPESFRSLNAGRKTMEFPNCMLDLTLLWWVSALLGPCLLALIPVGSAQKGGRP